MKSGRDIHRGEGIELLTPPLRGIFIFIYIKYILYYILKYYLIDDYVFEYEDG